MSNFINIEIGELGTTITGKTPSSDFPEDFGNEYMFITPSDSFDNKTIYETNRYLSMEGLQKLKNKVLTPKSVLVSCIGSAMGKITMNYSISITNQQINSIIIDSKYDSDYIYYILKNNYKLLRNASSGSTALPMLNKTDFDKLKITIHKDKITQQKIAKILSDLDTKIELNNRINSELEAMAKTLYDYWFVQFDFPDANGKPYKSSGGKMVWNEELKREIPEEWEVHELSNLLTIKYGKDHKKLNEGSIPVYGSGGIMRYVDKAIYDNEAILIPRKGSIGNLFYIAEPFWSVDTMFYTISKVKDSTLYYFYQLSKLNLKTLNVGTAVPSLTTEVLNQIKLLVPHSEVILKFNSIISKNQNQILINAKQNQELASLRDWLLPMLMNGQVKVADGEEMIEEQLEMVAECGVEYKVNLTDKDKKIRRKMLATYIINQSLNDNSFGKTKFEKLLHLIECHIVKGDYNQRYSVQAAGPYDGGFTKVFWNEVTKAKWYKIVEFGMLKRIMPAENHAKSLVDYGYLSDDLKLMINDFIGEFKNTNYERPEIVSTLYAVWNNRIIRNEIITDELLMKDFLEWDTQKARYKDRLDKALKWMRENSIIPDGWGSEIKRVKK